MDIIGKAYRDYFLEDLKLDGKSHYINQFSIGGIGNIINDKNIISYIEKNNNAILYIISDKEIKYLLQKKCKINIPVMYHLTEKPIPSAVILEQKNMRTSFVLQDEIHELDQIKKNSDSAIIYYGDKIRFSSLISYKYLYIDTAGNKYEDLYFDYSDNSDKIFISISSEYLTNELIDYYTKNANTTIISHMPRSTEIITSKTKHTIKNNYYLSSKIEKVTGLGDKFFLIMSLHHNESKEKSLLKSIVHAQRFLFNLINSK